MPAVTIEPELFTRAEAAAREQNASIGDILSEAVRRYLWELDRLKISEESKIYRQRHSELKIKYLNQYLAMNNGQVVDHDTDFYKLRQRIRQRFDRAPVMITLVEDSPESPLTRHGIRIEVVSS